jgi:hypothetical protein
VYCVIKIIRIIEFDRYQNVSGPRDEAVRAARLIDWSAVGKLRLQFPN